VDLHHLLLAGLPAHFESSHPSHGVGSLWRVYSAHGLCVGDTIYASFPLSSPPTTFTLDEFRLKHDALSAARRSPAVRSAGCCTTRAAAR